MSDLEPGTAPARDIKASSPEDPIAEVATLLARGYLRLLARKAAPGAASHAQGSVGCSAESLADVGERRPHGRRG